MGDGSAGGKEAAAVALSNLSANNDANKKAIAEAGGLPALVALVRDGSDGGQQAAAFALARVAVAHANKQAVAGGASRR